MPRKHLLVGLITIATLSATTLIAQTPSAPPEKSAKIKSSGCVRAGVEGSCIVLEDSKDKKLYNLFFPSDNKPAMDTAISFVGTEHNGMTTCMQGTAVNVSKWKPSKAKCSKAAATNTTKPDQPK